MLFSGVFPIPVDILPPQNDARNELYPMPLTLLWDSCTGKHHCPNRTLKLQKVDILCFIDRVKIDQYNVISIFSITYITIVYIYIYIIIYSVYIKQYIHFFIILIIQNDTVANLTTCPLRSSHAQIFRWKPVWSTMIRPKDWATTKAPISRHHTLVATVPFLASDCIGIMI